MSRTKRPVEIHMNNPTDTNQDIDMIPDELDMFIATHTSVSDDTDDGVYREAEYHALKKALDNLVKKHERQARLDELDKYFKNYGDDYDHYIGKRKDEIKQELEKL